MSTQSNLSPQYPFSLTARLFHFSAYNFLALSILAPSTLFIIYSSSTLSKRLAEDCIKSEMEGEIIGLHSGKLLRVTLPVPHGLQVKLWETVVFLCIFKHKIFLYVANT